MSSRASRVGYADAMSTLAVFLALGGGAWALAKNSVDERAIENGSVRSQELKDDDVRGVDIETNAVGSSEVADGALGSAEVGDGTLSGADVADRSLGAAEVADGALGAAQIANGSLTGAEVTNGSLTGADVANGSLTGLDLETGSIDPEDVDPLGDGLALPVRGGTFAQLRDIGTGGDLLFGPVSGRGAADPDMAEVQMATPNETGEFGRLFVWLETAPAAGESRTFSLVRRGSPSSAILDTGLSCTVPAGQEFCTTDQFVLVSTQLIAIEVDNTGAGLSASDDAYLGIEYGVRI